MKNNTKIFRKSRPLISCWPTQSRYDPHSNFWNITPKQCLIFQIFQTFVCKVAERTFATYIWLADCELSNSCNSNLFSRNIRLGSVRWDTNWLSWVSGAQLAVVLAFQVKVRCLRAQYWQSSDLSFVPFHRRFFRTDLSIVSFHCRFFKTFLYVPRICDSSDN